MMVRSQSAEPFKSSVGAFIISLVLHIFSPFIIQVQNEPEPVNQWCSDMMFISCFDTLELNMV